MTTTDPAMEVTNDSATPKSARTRARLIDCALSVFSRKGVDSAAISEIAQEAGLANGTFYIYFRDKAEIVRAVVDHMMTELFGRIHERIDPDWSAAEHLSFATREFVALTTHEEEWGYTMFRSLASVPELRLTASGYFLPLLKEGVARGEFSTTADEFLGNMITTMNMVAVSACLRDGASPLAVGARVAEYQLRILGLDPEQALEIANRPLGVSDFGA